MSLTTTSPTLWLSTPHKTPTRTPNPNPAPTPAPRPTPTAAPPSPLPLSHFHVFGLLPLELRQDVYAAILRLQPRCTSPLNLSISRPSARRTPPSALLSVCRESRQYALSAAGGYALLRTAAAFRSDEGSGWYLRPREDVLALKPPCPVSCWTTRNCFECVHFEYATRLQRYEVPPAGEGGDGVLSSVRGIAVWDFKLEYGGLREILRVFGGATTVWVVLEGSSVDFLTAREEVQERVVNLVDCGAMGKKGRDLVRTVWIGALDELIEGEFSRTR